MICFTSRESSEDPIYEDIDSLETSLSSIDNLHAVQEENTCDTYSKVVCAITILLFNMHVVFFSSIDTNQ